MRPASGGRRSGFDTDNAAASGSLGPFTSPEARAPGLVLVATTTVARMADREAPDRNLALELVRVTESAALAASRWVGRGDKNGADGAAVEAMRTVLSTVPMDGIVIIGEGEKDEAPMLFNGERIGDGTPPHDRHRRRPDRRHDAHLARTGQRARRSSPSASGARMFDPGPCVYMEKIAVGPDAAGSIDITASATQNLRWVAKAKRESVRDLTVMILDRDRHTELIAEVRASGRAHPADQRRRHLRRDRDGVAGSGRRRAHRHRRHTRGRHRRRRAEVHGRRAAGQALAAQRGGAISCAGRRLRPRRRADHRRPRPRRQLLLRRDGHHRRRAAARACTSTPAARRSQSLVMRSKSGTVRLINSRHRIDKLARFASVDYG